VQKAKKLDRQGFDLIHVQGSPFGCKTKTPTVVTVHSLLRTEWQYEKSVKFYLGRYFEKVTLDNASKLISVSHTLRDELIKNYGVPSQKIEVIPNFVDISEFEALNQEPSNPKTAMSCGRNVKRKDFLTFRKACESIGLNYNLFHGELSRERLIREIKKSFVFVMPSLYESFGIVLIEAMACRRPVISTFIPSSVEVMSMENGFFFSPRNIDQLSGYLTMLRDNEKLCERMGTKGYQHVKENFNPEKAVKETIHVYEDVLK
jgi:glycosyltransferase involved in cell wall biosynthesis